MGKITVTGRNAMGIDVKIREGNAGVYVTRALVKNGGTYNLVLDPNATYRDQIRMPDNTALEPVFSSDDVVESKETLIKKEGSEYVWEGICLTTAAPEAAPESAGAPPTGFLSIVKGFFGWST